MQKKKQNYKQLLKDRIKLWKSEQSNYDALAIVNEEFLDNYFKILLINYPKDSNWIHNLSKNESNYGCISPTPWPTFSDSTINCDELLAINLISQNDDGKEMYDEKKKKDYDILNIVIDASGESSIDEIDSLSKKYIRLANNILSRTFSIIEANYGSEFLQNLKRVLEDNKASENDLKISLSFINLNDDVLNVDNVRNLFKTKYDPLDDEELILNDDLSINFFNNQKMVELYDQCINCQWPYIGTNETIDLTSRTYCVYEVPELKLTGYSCNISAKSLAKLYKKYKNGLFSGNIRYFITTGKGSRDVNEGIKSSIKDSEKRKMFYFYNNGVTIISPSVKMGKDKTVELNKFSIVNGGQTTYLVGTVPFDVDFTIPCKILEIKCDISNELEESDPEAYKENMGIWLKYAGEISYALNSQKPVSKKHLISNRPQVRKMKDYYTRNGNGIVYFLTKAGEETFLPSYQKEKFVKLESYLSLIFCFFFQVPGFVKNKKSQMYSEGNFKKVMGNDDDVRTKLFLSPIQLFCLYRVQKEIDKVVSNIGKQLKRNPDQFDELQKIKIGVLKYSKNMILALCGIARMWNTEPEIFDDYISWENFEQILYKKPHGVNLNRNIFNQESITKDALWKEAIWKLLDSVIYPGYEQWRNDELAQGQTEVSARMFSMKDETYHQYVLSRFIQLMNKNYKEWFKIFVDIMDISEDD